MKRKFIRNLDENSAMKRKLCVGGWKTLQFYENFEYPSKKGFAPIMEMIYSTYHSIQPLYWKTIAGNLEEYTTTPN